MSAGRAAHPFMGLAPDEPDQVLRLHRFRQTHPGAIIGDGGFGTFQARIPEENGETVITRYSLRELLDKLDEVTAGQQDQPEDG
jgi:hypothetical protein